MGRAQVGIFDGVIPDSVRTRPKGDAFFADRPGGGCFRIQKDGLEVSGLEDDLFESGMTAANESHIGGSGSLLERPRPEGPDGL
jgi:hypothetical protein